jgi:hypothetical protein
MDRSGSITTRGVLIVTLVLAGLVIAAFVLAHIGGGRGITRL